MRGSAAFRAAVAPGGVLAGPWVKNELWRRARAVPSLDLRFADNKSLVDATTGAQLVTFTRASSGTYVDSQGTIRSATTNLLLRSEEFDNASWSKNAASISANSLAAPTGAITADTLIEDATTAEHYAEQVFSTVSGTTYTFSVYAKSDGVKDKIILRFTTANWSGSASNSVRFDLTTGVGTSVSGSPTFSSQAIGQGWWRFLITSTSSSTGSAAARIHLVATGGTAISYTGDGTSGLFLWGAQLEQSSTVGEYIPTTSTINSAPRFDHNPTTGESLGLLVEEQRTNLLLRSEELDNASWTKSAVSVTANSTTAPDGLTTADSIIEDTSNANHIALQNFTSTSGTVYSYSCYLKAGARSFAFLTANGTGTLHGLSINLSTGAVSTAVGSPISATSLALPDGWYRVAFSYTSGTTGTVSHEVRLTTDGVWANRTYTGNGTGSVFAWGAQLEAGAFPTSYIPTTTATVTRSADVASISGSNFSSWYRADEGTVFAETQLPAGSAVNTLSRSIIDATDGTTNNRISFRAIAGGSTLDQLTIRSGSTTTAQFSSNGTVVSSAARKVVAVYKLNDFASWATGATSAATDTSGALPIGVNQLAVGSAVGGGEYLSGTIKRLAYWPTRLPNSTLQAVTQ